VEVRKANILIPYSCRSDTALTKPIIDRLQKEDWCNVLTFSLVPAEFGNNFQYIRDQIQNGYKKEYKPDLIYITGDRVEMCAASMASFLNHIPICHYGGGITNTIATFDDILRHNITLMADIELCEDQRSTDRVSSICNVLKLNKLISTVGNLYIEDIDKVDESLVPNMQYDLILYNKTTLNKDDFRLDIELSDQIILIGPNPDCETKDLIESKIEDSEIIYYNNLPRSQFLGLLKNCSRYITNSSSAFYEAPYFLKPENIIKIGSRNSNRSTDFNEMQKYPNTANRIIEILKTWWLKNGKADL
jgi:UDP-N-acetylglucosamine 2-epimerase